MQRPSFLSLLVVALAVPFLVGCGDDDPAGEADETASPASEPEPGGTLRVGTFATLGSLTSLSPLGSYNVGNDPVGLYLDGLFARGEGGALEPALATSWEVSPDGLRVTIVLRPGVVWHDGEPFGADDVVFSLDSYRSPDVLSFARENLTNVPFVSITAIGDDMVEIVLERSYPDLLDVLSEDGNVFILPHHLLQGEDLATTAFNTAPVGTGPFRVTGFRPNEFITLEANDGYWGGRPVLDEVIATTLTDPSAAFAQLRAGDLDFVALSARQAVALEGDADLAVHTFPGANCRSLVFNFTVAPFDQAAVRQAISYSIDRDAIVQAVFSGLAEPVWSVFAPSEFDTLTATRPYPYDPSRAAASMTAAGFVQESGRWTFEGRAITVGLHYLEDRTIDADLAAVMATSLAAAGFDSQVRGWSFDAFAAEATGLTSFLYAAGVGLTLDVVSTYHHSSRQLATGGGFGLQGVVRPEWDALIERGQSETDVERRKEAYASLDALFVEDPPAVPLYCASVSYGAAAGLGGPELQDPSIGRGQTVNIYSNIERWRFHGE